MSDALRVNIYTQKGEAAVVRGLPRVVMDRIGVEQRWSSEQHAWIVGEEQVPDLCAMLENEHISPRTHDKPAPPWTPPTLGAMTPEEAEQATQELVGLYGIIETRILRMTYVATDFVRRKGWVALGYTSLEEYSKDRLPFQLPRQVRKELIATLVADGISIRAAATIARTTDMTARRDLAGATNVAPDEARVGMDGKTYPVVREGPVRRTYEPVEPSAIWTPTERPVPSLVADKGHIDPCVEATLSAFATDTITAAPGRIMLLRGACERWLDEHGESE
jgi:hypothetical protein